VGSAGVGVCVCVCLGRGYLSMLQLILWFAQLPRPDCPPPPTLPRALTHAHPHTHACLTPLFLPCPQALILNDNRIASVAGLQRLRFLTTLVLSGNCIADVPAGAFDALTCLEKLSLARVGFPPLALFSG
jgi:hypothetical protein